MFDLFDLFGRKRIRQLEEALADKDRLFNIQQIGWLDIEAKARASANQVEYLVRTIRDMDTQIWQISQQTSWPSMRPYFQPLVEGMIARKRQESDRINSVLHSELIDTYKPSPGSGPGPNFNPNIPKQIRDR